MPILKRDDGVHFVVRPYREMLSAKKNYLLKREFRFLARNNGDFACCFKENSYIEAVFSREPGYLLGETVWDYFKRPRDMLYCEAVDQGRNIIVVIVMDGRVHVDAKLPRESLSDELASVVSGNNCFNIFVVGDVPLSERPEVGKFALDRAFVDSFTIVEHSVFSVLPVLQDFQLIPVEQAIQSQLLDQRFASWWSSLGLLLLIGAALWWTMPVQVKPTNPIIHNPYKRYEANLMTPGPEQVLSQLCHQLTMMYEVPGWHMMNYKYANQRLTVHLRSAGGDLAHLKQWAQQENAAVDLTTQGVELQQVLHLQNREPPSALVGTQQAMALLVDRINQILPDKGIQIQSSVDNRVYTETKLSVQFKNLLPDQLAQLGHAMMGLPVVMNGLSANVSDGLMNGELDISILGN